MKRQGDGSHEGASRGHEGHEEELTSRMTRCSSPLATEAEQAMTAVIGCAIAVHRALGPGFLESIYKRAMYIELEARGLTYVAERPVRVVYRGIEIPGQRIDLIVMGCIVVELKSVSRLERVHVAQVISYLRTVGLRGGLLINFQVPELRMGLKRIVL
jgi:GxxExxY protein